MEKKFVYFIPTIIVIGVILYATLSSDPLGNSPLPPIPHLDKLIHAVMMGVLLSVFAFDWQRAYPEESLTTSFLWAVFGCVLAFSIADELLQGALDNGRSGDPYDFLADCIGAAIAVYLAPPIIKSILRLCLPKKAGTPLK